MKKTLKNDGFSARLRTKRDPIKVRLLVAIKLYMRDLLHHRPKKSKDPVNHPNQNLTVLKTNPNVVPDRVLNDGPLSSAIQVKTRFKAQLSTFKESAENLSLKHSKIHYFERYILE